MFIYFIACFSSKFNKLKLMFLNFHKPLTET